MSEDRFRLAVDGKQLVKTLDGGKSKVTVRIDAPNCDIKLWAGPGNPPRGGEDDTAKASDKPYNHEFAVDPKRVNYLYAERLSKFSNTIFTTY